MKNPSLDVVDLDALSELLREDRGCVTCGGTSGLQSRGGVLFCGDCLAWTRQAELDPLFDDLGVGD